MNDRQERFIKLLENIFELDKSDLDFGIYRIMNIRRAEIEKFFKEGLPKKINETLAPFAGADSATIRKRMADIETALGGVEVIAQMPAAVPMVAEYNDLKKKLAEGVDISALESDVYSALYSFFSRYYDDGDFISKRRYKEGVYAIPYEGEEVKLYWANQDQYYIKTSENFKDYTFKTNEADGITVHFRLVDATTEQNNNKEDDDKKRTFMLYTETEENPDLHTFEYDAEKRELIIRFIYDIPTNPKTKWHEANMKAINAWIAEHPELIGELLRNVSTKSGEFLPIIEKHLKGYVAKNTFDYFIHKDLGGFLRRELDFFIKNEVMHIDDIDTETETRVEAYLGKVRAIKRVGGVIIDFLAQVEDFQKRLWLKKKFVVETNYCITLDRIDERFYEEIAANEAQVKEWIEMYAIDEVAGFTTTPTIEFMRVNQNLIVDTRHFDVLFRDKLIASIDNLDEHINGIMLNADNFHGIRILQEKYKGQIKCIYIDPPYNSPSSTVLYKNSFKHSAWLSLMQNRLEQANTLSTIDGSIVTAIDKYEHNNLFDLLKMMYSEKDIVSVAVEHNKKGTMGDHFSYSNEYAIFTVPFDLKKLNKKVRLESEWEWSNFRNWGSESERADAANCFYPVYIQGGQIVGYGDVLADEIHPSANEIIIGEHTIYRPDKQEVKIVATAKNPLIAVYPIDNEGIERKWRYAFQSIGEIFEYLRAKVSRGSAIQIEMPKYEDQFKTLWSDSLYNAGDYGTKVLSSMGFTKKDFEFPKSVYTVKDCVFAVSDKDSIVFDFFAGSGTTGQSVMMLNAEDRGNRKYILVEMGEYFNKVTQPRIKKVVYASEWRDGKPKSRTTGVSHIMKYMRLESYEDALSNIELKKTGGISLWGEDYLINYMLNMESRDSLLSIDKFRSPFEYKMRITEKNECRERSVDVCETFNYLIGLKVDRSGRVRYFSTRKALEQSYDGAVDIFVDDDGIYGFKMIDGTLPDGRKALVIWRTITDDLLASNAALDAYFRKNKDVKREYDIIYINGDNNLENLRTDEEQWKVVMIEKEFNEKMWEE